MRSEGLIVQTKLTPTRPTKRMLTRPRVTARLMQALDVRLTVLQAGTGYGKTTALADLAQCDVPLMWYHLDTEDADPLVFLAHLIHGINKGFGTPSSAPLAIARTWQNSAPAQPTAVVDAVINELNQHLDQPALLILDDAHLLNQSAETIAILERLIRHAPANLHTILSCRHTLNLSNLVALRVRGELLEISERELAFTPEEIGALFRDQYGLSLSPEEIDLLARETEGWAIALQLVWQGLARSEAGGSLAEGLRHFSGLKEDLFSYLAQEVLEKQPPHLQDFLLRTSVLRLLSEWACDCLLDQTGSAAILRELTDSGLFVVELDAEHIRYHTLFREFLYGRLSEAERAALHLRAAECFRECGEKEEAISHTLRAGVAEEAADLILEIGRSLITAGRLETVTGWIGGLPPGVLEARPGLLTYLGDVARLHSRFGEAIRWYEQAEERCRARADLRGIAQALRGQARVYLDTVNPAMAEAPLREALRLSDGQEDRESRATLLEMLAENQLNFGRNEDAQRLQEQARELREEGPGEAELDVRVLLRTGRLDEAQARLEAQAEIERREPVLRPRAHRETLLLLSLIQVCRGEVEAAYRHAVEGTERGQALNSPFVTAVGYMRQGHAWLARNGEQAVSEARKCFEAAIALSERLDVSRLRVEANWGLCRAYGYLGDLASAARTAQQGIAIAREAGDEWIIAHIRVALGAGYAMAGRCNDALRELAEAEAGFQECSDTFGVAVARLWRCIVWHDSSESVSLAHELSGLLTLTQERGYDYIFTRRTLVGPPDPRRFVPLLLMARSDAKLSGYANGLIQQMGLEGLQLHPGYTLRVQALGSFRVWLGDREVGSGDWQRDKARQLFQLLLTSRRAMLDRELICGLLWPDLNAEAAGRDFKVALNALYRALEPRRESGALSAYVARDGSLYGLRPEADIWSDVEAFERAVSTGDTAFEVDRGTALEAYGQALELYQGDFLEAYLYEDWCAEERERLRAMYLRAADRLARGLLEARAWEMAISVCQSIIARDDCWENAYRLMMVAHARMGNRAQALRIYQNLVEHLREELDAEPAPETEALYHLILHSGLPDLPES